MLNSYAVCSLNLTTELTNPVADSAQIDAGVAGLEPSGKIVTLLTFFFSWLSPALLTSRSQPARFQAKVLTEAHYALFTLPTRRDKTVLSGLQLSSHRWQDGFSRLDPVSVSPLWRCEHNWRHDKTVLSCQVGGVNTTADKTRQLWSCSKWEVVVIITVADFCVPRSFVFM